MCPHLNCNWCSPSTKQCLTPEYDCRPLIHPDKCEMCGGWKKKRPTTDGDPGWPYVQWNLVCEVCE